MKTKTNFLMSAVFVLVAASAFGQTTLPDDVVRVGDREFRFGQPTNLAALSSAAYEDASSITADGLTLFFESDRPDGMGLTDIWMSTRPTASSPWGPSVNLGSPVNSAADDGSPRISPDGLSLYFASYREGGSGGGDIWVTTRPTRTDAFGTPVNLGSMVNSTAEDFGPWISADGLCLLFCSIDRPGGLGGGDIWISTRTNRAAPWEPARNLGAPVNTENFELFPCLSADGLLLFFMGGTPPLGGNVYVSKRDTTSSAFGPRVRVGAIGELTDRARPHALSADGTTLYYGSFERSGGLGDWDLWQISMTPLPQLRGLTATGDGQIQFDLLGREGANYTVDTSADLRTWTPWITTNTTDRVRLTDSVLPNQARRFYRAVTP
jgi:hypothetical protein